MRTFLAVTMLVSLSAPVSPAAAQQPPIKSSGRLADLVAVLEGSNPEIAAAQREIEMRAARVRPAGTPPDPVISAAFMGGFSSVPFFPPSSNPDALREFGIA